MGEDDILRRIREDHKRLVDLTRSAIGADLEHVEQVRREAIRAIGQTSALSTLFSQQGTFTDLLEQMKPMLQAFYKNVGVSRLISESAFAARGAMPAAFDTSGLLRNIVTQLFGPDWQKQFAGVDLSQSIISEQLKTISGAFTGVDFGIRFGDQLREPMRQLQELFEGYEEDERQVLNAIVPLGWLISPSMGMSTIRRLAAELDARTVEEIDDTLIRYFNPEKCAEIVSGLYNDPAFEELQPLIDEGLAVHTEGHYRAAILVWLAAIDGVAARKFGVRKLYGELKKKSGGKFRLAIEQTSGGREAFNEALIDILKRVSMTKEVEPHVPKRDIVMHGREIDFGNERASIQLLLVLEVMHLCDSAGREHLAIDAA
jgi:hypothetical protein